MQITAGKLYQSKDALERLGELKLPISKSWKISRLIKKCSSEIDAIEEKRIELIKRYGTEDPNNPDQYKVEEDQKNKYLQEAKELGEIQIDIDMPPMNIEEIFKTSSGEEVEISSVDLLLLESFFESSDG